MTPDPKLRTHLAEQAKPYVCTCNFYRSKVMAMWMTLRLDWLEELACLLCDINGNHYHISQY